MSDDIRVVVSMRANPGKEDAVKSAVMACVAPSRAEEGNISYAAHIDVVEPSWLVIVEHWKDAHVRDRHLSSDHFKAWSRAIDGGQLSEHVFFVLRPL
jgi:quinol monooxygenase YgiN